MGSYVNLKRDTAFAVFAIAIVAGTSILGQIATYPNLIPWYAGLAKPDSIRQIGFLLRCGRRSMR